MKLKKLMLPAMILFCLTACATGSSAINDYCLIYRPIYSSKNDTSATRDQIDGNNASWVKLCDGKR